MHKDVIYILLVTLLATRCKYAYEYTGDHHENKGNKLKVSNIRIYPRMVVSAM